MTHPPSGPSTPPPPSGPKDASLLAEIYDLIQRTSSRVSFLGEQDCDPGKRMRLDYFLDQARRAVADLQSPGRRSPSGGPVDSSRFRGEVRLGCPAASLPGADSDFALPRPPEWPGRPFPVLYAKPDKQLANPSCAELWPGAADLAASFVKRCD